jgi:hypothetical protein
VVRHDRVVLGTLQRQKNDVLDPGSLGGLERGKHLLPRLPEVGGRMRNI